MRGLAVKICNVLAPISAARKAAFSSEPKVERWIPRRKSYMLSRWGSLVRSSLSRTAGACRIGSNKDEGVLRRTPSQEGTPTSYSGAVNCDSGNLRRAALRSIGCGGRSVAAGAAYRDYERRRSFLPPTPNPTRATPINKQVPGSGVAPPGIVISFSRPVSVVEG